MLGPVIQISISSSDRHLVRRSQIRLGFRHWCAQHNLDPVLKLCLERPDTRFSDKTSKKEVSVCTWLETEVSCAFPWKREENPMSSTPSLSVSSAPLLPSPNGTISSIQPNPRVSKTSYGSVYGTGRTSNTL